MLIIQSPWIPTIILCPWMHPPAMGMQRRCEALLCTLEQCNNLRSTHTCLLW